MKRLGTYGNSKNSSPQKGFHDFTPKSGERCSFRFGPPAQQLLAVPEGGKAGDVMTFEGADGEALAAQG